MNVFLRGEEGKYKKDTGKTEENLSVGVRFAREKVKESLCNGTQMRERILQRIIQMLLHQFPGFWGISVFVCLKNLSVHLIDPALRFRFCFIQIGKNRQLAALLFRGKF